MEVSPTNDLICMIINCPSDVLLGHLENMLDEDLAKKSKDIRGRTPLHIAVMTKRVDIIEKLLERLTDEQKSIVDDDGKTPVDLATALNKPEIVAMLTRCDE